MTNPCEGCDGCGQIANTDDREPWSMWEGLPEASKVAIRLGIVRPIPCPYCHGTGVDPEDDGMIVCDGCRWWSTTLAQCEGGGPVEALCLNRASPHQNKYVHRGCAHREPGEPVDVPWAGGAR